MIRKIFFLGIVILIISGCGEISSSEKQDEQDEIGPPDGQQQFEVEVLSISGQPLDSATISGGLDWTSFKVQTNENGIAILPSYALGEGALIYRNNFFPYQVESLSPTQYFITPTPKQFKLIGDIAGWSIRFGPGTLITVDYHGGYHLYSYSDQGITEIASAQIAKHIKKTQLHGDKLWFSTHDEGIYVYSLEDPFSPQLMFQLEIPGCLGPFALKDTFVVVGDTSTNADSIRIYSYNTSGKCQEIARFGDYYVEMLAIIGNYLIVLNYYNCLPAIYDLRDPANPCLVYKSAEPDYWYGFLFRNYLNLIPRSISELRESQNIYKIIDLSNPADPLTFGFFSADSQLLEIINETTAIGRYYLWSGAISVLNGDMTQGFKTVAIITDNPFIQIYIHESEGCSPPYFIIGEQLWKLEN